MKEYLESYASEVENMLFTEFNMDDALRVRFEEGQETAAETIAANLLRNGAVPDFVSKNTGLSIDKILSLSKGIKQN
jgi:hypothetical protein